MRIGLVVLALSVAGTACGAAPGPQVATPSERPVGVPSRSSVPSPVSQPVASATAIPSPLAAPSLVAAASPAAAPGPPVSPATGEPVALAVRAVATGLDTPWALAFVPDGRLFITERPGRLRVVENGQIRPQPVLTLPVRETAEGGLLGLAADPGFAQQPYLYTMYTYDAAQGLRNRVVRLRVDGSTVVEDRILLDNLPAASIHDGGRVAIGPDGLLYITLGDATQGPLAQDRTSPAGKILRLNRDGSIPTDNPFPGSPVYALGLRNPEGLAWQPGSGRLYATDNGPTGNDEVNLIEAGQNYGWPEAQGPQHPAPFQAPLVTYTPAIAPSGATFYDGSLIPRWRGSLLFAALRGSQLRRLTFDPSDPRRVVTQEALYEGQFGRLRAVVQGPDDALYVSTSNQDGRGSPGAQDDQVLRIGPP